MPQNLWNENEARQNPALDGLVYRSNLLGRDRAVVNIYGGNTSAKLKERDHLGREVEVLWVKGSGSDVATITEKGFAGLRLAEILPLMGRERMSDEEMVAYLAHCTHALDRPRQSIETLLHAFTPARHVDHTHPDAIISLACTPNGPELCREIWGDRMVWVDYIRPGFTLSKWIGEGIRANPHAGLVIMGKHGLVNWGESSRECYDNTIRTIQEAEDFIASRRNDRRVYVSAGIPKLSAGQRRQLFAQVLPGLRGAVSKETPAILKVDDSERVLEFVNSQHAATWSQIGAACPDHLVHTKRTPLFVDWTPAEDVATLSAKLATGVQTYMESYRAYFDQCAHPGDEMRDPAPRVILVPGLGMVNTGPDALGADVSNQLYQRAIAVIEGSQSVGEFISLTPQEAYDVEYWPLELYKLKLRPAPREQAGRIAIVTGGASGIGRATARRLAEDGAHVAIFDINQEGAQVVAEELTKKHGLGRSIAVHCDVTDEEAVATAFQTVVMTYGGVDVVVSNAGIAISAPIEQTSIADWNKNMDILGKGYFLVSREAFRIWRQQGMGGSLVYVASKNSVFAGRNAAAYSAAKAAELHMARCLAEEGGAAGIRVNSVLPDAVLQGSGIWDAGWREARAKSYGIKPEELDDYYRQRTTLKVNVYPENIAEAISFLAGPRASRTTGAAITVDGGVAGAYLR
ncbi:MAG: bifunctional rhamnulose-1-phosphate aldolase/short-chain dehydrogenase [Chloroflexi bacterium]|nr:MAG: bifunctional rhamnulose-1-phosphate aldolase/short-chain dehydrogenase [Chloroflexota bacterium]